MYPEIMIIQQRGRNRTVCVVFFFHYPFVWIVSNQWVTGVLLYFPSTWVVWRWPSPWGPSTLIWEWKSHGRKSPTTRTRAHTHARTHIDTATYIKEEHRTTDSAHGRRNIHIFAKQDMCVHLKEIFKGGNQIKCITFHKPGLSPHHLIVTSLCWMPKRQRTQLPLFTTAPLSDGAENPIRWISS